MWDKGRSQNASRKKRMTGMVEKDWETRDFLEMNKKAKSKRKEKAKVY